jgi:hypothetical protein
MKRCATIIAALLLAPCLRSPVCAQVNGKIAGVIAQLLDHPAPPPPPPKELAEALAVMNGSYFNYTYGDPSDPGEDAPIKALIAYWELQARREGAKQPSEKIRQRLLQACEEEPEFPLQLHDFLPNTPEAHARLKRVLDDEQGAGFEPLVSFRQDSRGRLREWLMCNSEYLRDELIHEASSVKDDDGDVKGSWSLAALARMDWRTAEPLLKNYAEGGAPLTMTFALGLLYEHAARNNQSADAGNYRDRLKRIAGASQAPGSARAMAVEALMKTDWQGRDEWFISLFADRTISELTDGYRTINAIHESVKRDPDRWIPAVSRLIGHGDRNVHNAAALCLAQFVDRGERKDARKEALLPLLPWLSDPQWADTSESFVRVSLVESMVRLKMREALPGLIWIIRNDRRFIRTQAVEALAEMCDTSVVPVLREAIRSRMKNDDDYSPVSMIQALIACGGLSIEETLAALESCAENSEIRVNNLRASRVL